MCTVTSQYPSEYDLRCWKDIQIRQPASHYPDAGPLIHFLLYPTFSRPGRDKCQFCTFLFTVGLELIPQSPVGEMAALPTQRSRHLLLRLYCIRISPSSPPSSSSSSSSDSSIHPHIRILSRTTSTKFHNLSLTLCAPILNGLDFLQTLLKMHTLGCSI